MKSTDYRISFKNPLYVEVAPVSNNNLFMYIICKKSYKSHQHVKLICTSEQLLYCCTFFGTDIFFLCLLDPVMKSTEYHSRIHLFMYIICKKSYKSHQHLKLICTSEQFLCCNCAPRKVRLYKSKKQHIETVIETFH